MSGCVQYEQNSEMMVELYGEERKIIDFMPILEKYFNRKPCKVLEMTGEPDYGVGDFRIGQYMTKIQEKLLLLAENRGQVFSKKRIYETIWKEEYMYDDKNLTAYINKIRKKIERDPKNPEFIQTVWGVGYKFMN